MITEEERESIINEAVEKALLKLPEVIGSLMMNQANMMRNSREFYEKYPELKDQKAIVSSVFESIDSQNPGLPYEQLISKALPSIRDQVKTRLSLTNKIDKPNRKLPDFGAI